MVSDATIDCQVRAELLADKLCVDIEKKAEAYFWMLPLLEKMWEEIEMLKRENRSLSRKIIRR